MTFKNDDFVIFENDNGDLMLSIKAREEEPSSSKMIVAANRNAILYRNSKNPILLEGIHPEIITKIMSLNEILVGEVIKENDFKYIYTARIIKVDKLPNINGE